MKAVTYNIFLGMDGSRTRRMIRNELPSFYPLPRIPWNKWVKNYTEEEVQRALDEHPDIVSFQEVLLRKRETVETMLRDAGFQSIAWADARHNVYGGSGTIVATKKQGARQRLSLPKALDGGVASLYIAETNTVVIGGHLPLYGGKKFRRAVKQYIQDERVKTRDVIFLGDSNTNDMKREFELREVGLVDYTAKTWPNNGLRSMWNGKYEKSIDHIVLHERYQTEVATHAGRSDHRMLVAEYALNPHHGCMRNPDAGGTHPGTTLRGIPP